MAEGEELVQQFELYSAHSLGSIQLMPEIDHVDIQSIPKETHI